jgi:FMN phosphatase YigB (HAD superfamily)
LDKRAHTIFCDIDGTLIVHNPPTETTIPTHRPKLLPNTIEKLLEWDKKGYNIILVSGRREGARQVTEKQLAELGIIYDKLILGIGGGKRYIINDKKPYSDDNCAIAINLERNTGIGKIDI